MTASTAAVTSPVIPGSSSPVSSRKPVWRSAASRSSLATIAGMLIDVVAVSGRLPCAVVQVDRVEPDPDAGCDRCGQGPGRPIVWPDEIDDRWPTRRRAPAERSGDGLGRGAELRRHRRGVDGAKGEPIGLDKGVDTAEVPGDAGIKPQRPCRRPADEAVGRPEQRETLERAVRPEGRAGPRGPLPHPPQRHRRREYRQGQRGRRVVGRPHRRGRRRRAAASRHRARARAQHQRIADERVQPERGHELVDREAARPRALPPSVGGVPPRRVDRPAELASAVEVGGAAGIVATSAWSDLPRR